MLLHDRNIMSTTYIIGDNTGGKYFAGEGGKPAETTLKVPTQFLTASDDNAQAVSLKLLHDRGAVYSAYRDGPGGEKKVALVSTGPDPVIQNFERCTGEDWEIAQSVIPYTTHTDCMVAFGGRKCWMNNGAKVKSADRTDGDNSNNIELWSGLIVIAITRIGDGRSPQFEQYLTTPDGARLYAVQVDDWLLELDKSERIFTPPGEQTNEVKLVSSDNRCLFWNKTDQTVYEIVFKGVISEPTIKTIWDAKDDPVTDIVGGTDGRFIVVTSRRAFLLTGDKLDEIKIPNEELGGDAYKWALGHGWEIYFGYDKIWGRGKSRGQWL